MADSQDWTQVVLKKNKVATTSRIQEKRTPEAQRIGALERKIDNNETIVRKKVTSDTMRALVSSRLDKKLTQDGADMLCGFPKHTFREIEAGRLLPNSRHMSTLQKLFGVPIKFQ